MAGKRKCDYLEVVAFRKRHPEMTAAEIGERFDRDAQTVQWILRKYGLGVGQGNYMRSRAWHYRSKFRAAVVRLSREQPGLTPFAVGTDVGCTAGMVLEIWKEIGHERKFKRCRICGIEAQTKEGMCWVHKELQVRCSVCQRYFAGECPVHGPKYMTPIEDDWVLERTVRLRARRRRGITENGEQKTQEQARHLQS